MPCISGKLGVCKIQVITNEELLKFQSYVLNEPRSIDIYIARMIRNDCLIDIYKCYNSAWLKRKLPMNQRVAVKVEDFELPKSLHMDKAYFKSRIHPHMFYITYENIWLWKMNTARSMGNSLNSDYIPDLIRAFKENDDERVKGMIAWSLENWVEMRLSRL
jgi:epoxyqueuosine reductase